ncbi:hypothetical protein C0Q70_18885 [Pomacea canaliculata]|uniref:Uncharacterized protein n=1 Tax=Pomacea canaliculata TaxID=400727 RepID=A0A2T7NHU2_POMCA|nr:hypothetical protein C0Q70_18885 [Pomacea canaliculata]
MPHSLPPSEQGTSPTAMLCLFALYHTAHLEGLQPLMPQVIVTSHRRRMYSARRTRTEVVSGSTRVPSGVVAFALSHWSLLTSGDEAAAGPFIGP